jgi:hypothetical protein
LRAFLKAGKKMLREELVSVLGICGYPNNIKTLPNEYAEWFDHRNGCFFLEGAEATQMGRKAPSLKVEISEERKSGNCYHTPLIG